MALSIVNNLWLAFVDAALRALRTLLRYADPSRRTGHVTRDGRIMSRNFRTAGWGNTGAVLRDSRSTRRVEEPLFNGSVLFHPFVCSVSRYQPFRAGRSLSSGVWALVVFRLVINCVTEMSFSRCSLTDVPASFTLPPSRLPRFHVPMLNLFIRSPRALRSVHDFSQTAGSLARALGPAIATPLFAFTLQDDWLGGLGVYAVLITTSL